MIFLFCEIDFYEYGLPQLKEYTERAAVCTDIEEWKESVLSGYRVARQELERKFDITGAEAARWEQAALKYIEEQEAAWVYEKAREELLKFDYSQRVEAFEAVIEGVAVSGKDALELANQLRKEEAARLEEAIEERAAQVKARWLSELKSSVTVEEFKRLVELAAARLKAEWRGELDEAARRAFAGVFERGGDQLRKEAESQRAEDRLSWILYEIKKDIEELTPTLEGIKRIKDPVEFREKWKEAIGEVVKRGLKKWALAIETVEGLKKEWIDQAVEDREEGESRWEAAYRELLKERDTWRRQIKQLIEEGRQLWKEKYQEFNRNLTEAQKEYDEYWNQVEESYSRILEDASGVGQIASGIEQAGEAIEFYKKLGEPEKASEWEELQSDLESALDDIKEEIEKVVLNPEGLLGDEIKQLWGEGYDLALIYTPEGQNYIKAKAALAWWEKKLQIAEYARAYMSGNYDISWWIKPYETWESEPSEEEIEAACAILGVDPVRGAEAVEKYFNYELHTDYDIIDWELATRILKQVAYSRYQAAKEEAKEALADIVGSKATVSGIWDYIKQMQAEEKTLRDSYGAYIIAYQALQDKEKWLEDIKLKVKQLCNEATQYHQNYWSHFKSSLEALSEYLNFYYLSINQEALDPYKNALSLCQDYDSYLSSITLTTFSNWIGELSGSQIQALNIESEALLTSFGIPDWNSAQQLMLYYKTALNDYASGGSSIEEKYENIKKLYTSAIALAGYYKKVYSALSGYTKGLKGEQTEEYSEFNLLKKKIEEFKNILFKAKTYIDEAAEVELAIENIEQDIINGTDTKTVEEISRLIAAAELLKAIKVEDVVGWFNSTIANCQTALSELEILGHVPTSEDLENIKANKGEDVALILYGVYPGMDTVELTTAYISAQADYIGWLANSTGLKASASLTVLKSDFENVKEVVSGIEDDLTGLNFTQIRSELEKIASLRLPFQIEQYIFDLIQKIKAVEWIEAGEEPGEEIEDLREQVKRLNDFKAELEAFTKLDVEAPFSEENRQVIKDILSSISNFSIDEIDCSGLKEKLEEYNALAADYESEESWQLTSEEERRHQISLDWIQYIGEQTDYTAEDAPSEFKLYVIYKNYTDWLSNNAGGTLDEYLEDKGIKIFKKEKELIERVCSSTNPTEYLILLKGEAALTEARRLAKEGWDGEGVPDDHSQKEEIIKVFEDYSKALKEIEALDPWDEPQSFAQKLYRWAGYTPGVVYTPDEYHLACAKVYEKEAAELISAIKQACLDLISQIEQERSELEVKIEKKETLQAYKNEKFECEDARKAFAFIPGEVGYTGAVEVADYNMVGEVESSISFIKDQKEDEAKHEALKRASFKNHKLELYIQAVALLKEMKNKLSQIEWQDEHDASLAGFAKDSFESAWELYQSERASFFSTADQIRKRLMSYHLLKNNQQAEDIKNQIKNLTQQLMDTERRYAGEINKEYGIQAETPYEAYTKAVEAYAEALASYDKAVKVRLEAYKLYDSATWEHRAAREVYLFATNPYLYKSSEYFADPDFLASLPKYDAEDNYKLVEEKYNQAKALYDSAVAQLQEIATSAEIASKAQLVAEKIFAISRVAGAYDAMEKQTVQSKKQMEESIARYRSNFLRVIFGDSVPDGLNCESDNPVQQNKRAKLHEAVLKFISGEWTVDTVESWWDDDDWRRLSATDKRWDTDLRLWLIKKVYMPVNIIP